MVYTNKQKRKTHYSKNPLERQNQTTWAKRREINIGFKRNKENPEKARQKNEGEKGKKGADQAW